jgi:hypothetical protein
MFNFDLSKPKEVTPKTRDSEVNTDGIFIAADLQETGWEHGFESKATRTNKTISGQKQDKYRVRIYNIR